MLINIPCLSACNPGQYLYARDGSCTDCETDYYGAGVWLESCTKCPEAKGVEAGKGTKESDCTWSKFKFLSKSPERNPRDPISIIF